MANQITEKYFYQEDFSKREKEVLEQVTQETGFIVEQEIYRGKIYDSDKVGDLIYKGEWKGKPAVLKIQGLRPEVDEGEIVKNFRSQNQSDKVRTPQLYVHSPWREDRGYGYLITEYIEGSKIFQMPFAGPKERKDFADFYQEYRTSALTRSWLDPETEDSLSFVTRKVDHWRQISESKGRLNLSDYAPYLMRFYPLAVKHLPPIPMVFCHAHLTAHDIFKEADDSYVVFSNLFWSYRPQWYDLAFNIWACLLHIQNTDYTFEQVKEYVEEWLDVYREIPVVKQDPEFETKIHILLLERTIGAILVDLGAGDFYDHPENKKYFDHLLAIHQQLFTYLAGKLE